MSTLACNGSEDDKGSGEKPVASPAKSSSTPETAQEKELAKPKAPVLSDDEYAKRYEVLKAQVFDPNLQDSASAFGETIAGLKTISQKAKDPHLRANANMVLATVHSERKDLRSAISYYREAVVLVPKEASVHAMLAIELMKDKQFKAAIDTQRQVVELLPDDLEARYYLGEFYAKSGDAENSKRAFIDYEARRKGILDGLTLKKDGKFIVSAEERFECARQLEPLVDNGTAVALLYALKFEPEPEVRGEVVRVMGAQRLIGYKKFIQAQLKSEKDPKVAETMRWAISEIERDGVETTPGEAPETPALDGANAAVKPNSDKPSQAEGKQKEGE